MTTTAPLDITAPPGEPVITFRRFLKAPPELVWDAFTKPEHMRNWYGPRYLEIVKCDVDLRVGGEYRMVHRAPDGQEFGFHGTFREIDRPRRLVQTWVFEGMPDAESVETMELDAVDGGTLVRATSVHPSVEVRDTHLANGMEDGARESYERLDEVLAELTAVR